jgi:hypothetical protein
MSQLWSCRLSPTSSVGHEAYTALRSEQETALKHEVQDRKEFSRLKRGWRDRVCASALKKS